MAARPDLLVKEFIVETGPTKLAHKWQSGLTIWSIISRTLELRI